ncbi:MAG: hypothetical protein AAF988_03115 [Pseudomonadota bacterium]
MTLNSKKLSLSILLAGTVFCAPSAQAMFDWLPSGYTHHGKIYKSKTPQPSPRVSPEQRDSMNSLQAEQFRSATSELLTRLTSRAGLPPKPSYIDAADPMTAFYANIDNDLREAMRSQGYHLVSSPEGAYIFKYSASILPGYRSYDIKKAGMGAPNVEITLDVMTNIQGQLKTLTRESGTFYIDGAEKLFVPAAHHKNLPYKLEDRFQPEETYIEPRTATSLNSSARLHTTQPIMDKTQPPIVDIVEAPPTFVMDAPAEPFIVSEPSDVVISSPMVEDALPEIEPILMQDEAAIQIFDPETSVVTDTYDYSASINELNNFEPVRRGPRVSKAIEY